jgi:ribosomal protein L16 Arg81 hydroxylase
MSILESLVLDIGLNAFKERHFQKEPYAAPYRAEKYRNFLSWIRLKEIIENPCHDCWLPREGKLPEVKELSTGTLTFSEALNGFADGRTVLVRHSERHSKELAEIAAAFKTELGGDIDIQLYFTPAGEEGFNWHYDAEDVFVIQSFGAKEFRLLKNTTTPRPYKKNAEQSEDFKNEKMTPEIRCLLQAGDWLYIPAGYWHKARAVSDSFHLSVGVMPPGTK